MNINGGMPSQNPKDERKHSSLPPKVEITPSANVTNNNRPSAHEHLTPQFAGAIWNNGDWTSRLNAKLAKQGMTADEIFAEAYRLRDAIDTAKSVVGIEKVPADKTVEIEKVKRVEKVVA